MLAYWLVGYFVYLIVSAVRWSVHVRLRNAVVAFDLIIEFLCPYPQLRLLFIQSNLHYYIQGLLSWPSTNLLAKSRDLAGTWHPRPH